MSKTLSRLVLGLCLVGASLTMVGCSEGEKPATTPAPSTEAAPATPPAEGGAAPAPAPATPPAEPAK